VDLIFPSKPAKLADGAADDKKKQGVKSKTIGDVCRDSFRLPVERTGEGWAVILTRERLDIAKLRLGLDREAEYDPNSGLEEAGVVTVKKADPVQERFLNDAPQVGRFNEETGEWDL